MCYVHKHFSNYLGWQNSPTSCHVCQCHSTVKQFLVSNNIFSYFLRLLKLFTTSRKNTVGPINGFQAFVHFFSTNCHFPQTQIPFFLSQTCIFHFLPKYVPKFMSALGWSNNFKLPKMQLTDKTNNLNMHSNRVI